MRNTNIFQIYTHNKMSIPKIIHQTWKTKDLPENFKKWSDSWKILNPDFKYKFYTDTDCFVFINYYYPEYINLYQSLVGIEKVDMFRYLILHKYGGVYCDMDTECIRPINKLIDWSGLITGYEYENPVQYLQWFIASPPGNKILIELVKEINFRSYFRWFKTFTLSENRLVYWLTGPEMYTDVLNKHKNQIKILRKGILGCYDTKQMDEETYLIHWFSGTWKSKKCNFIIKT